MSVETLEAPVVEALGSVETSVKSARCAILAGAALACAGCWLVETCKQKAEVEQGSNSENEAEKPSADSIQNFVETDLLFPELDLFQIVAATREAVPEKIITPPPYEVKNTTPTYMERLMDDSVQVVLADSITRPSEPRKAEVFVKPLAELVPLKVESLTPVVEVVYGAITAEPTESIEMLDVASVEIEEVSEPLELAPSEEIIVDAPIQPEPEIIVAANKPLAPAIEKEIKPEILTNNILRPIAEVVVKNVIKVAKNISEIKPKPKTTIIKTVDSPIFYNIDLSEIIDENVAPIDVGLELKPEVEAMPDDEAEVIEVVETRENIIEVEDEAEEAEVIQIEAEDRLGFESRLYEALLNGDDTLDPESRLSTRKIINKLKILHQLALRALRFSL